MEPIIHQSKTYRFTPAEGVEFDCYIMSGRYSNGRLALLFVDAHDGESISDITKNVPEAFLEEDEIIIDHNYSQPLIKVLQQYGIATLTKKVVPSGYVVMPVMKITPEYRKRFLI